MSSPPYNLTLSVEPIPNTAPAHNKYGATDLRGDIDKFDETQDSTYIKSDDLVSTIKNMKAVYGIDFGTTPSVIEINNTLDKDFKGIEEGRIKFDLSSGSNNFKGNYSIDVTPEKINELIKLMKDTTDEGLIKRQELEKNYETSKPLSTEDSNILIETMNAKLVQGIVEINRSR